MDSKSRLQQPDNSMVKTSGEETSILNLKNLEIIERVLFPESFPDFRIAANDFLYVKGSFTIGEPGYAYKDSSLDQIITIEDPEFDLFFSYKLRQLDILEIDSFLNDSFDYYYPNSSKAFSRFLRLCIRKHSHLFEKDQIITIEEWIESVPAHIETTTKSKVKRTRDDNITKLNQEQTALLIYCLQKTKVILTDEYLNNKEAGQAFSLLTGYSADTIRQNLNKSELGRIATSKNVEAVTKTLSELKQLIDKEIKPE